jgi:hypothetical protein
MTLQSVYSDVIAVTGLSTKRSQVRSLEVPHDGQVSTQGIDDIGIQGSTFQ